MVSKDRMQNFNQKRYVLVLSEDETLRECLTDRFGDSFQIHTAGSITEGLALIEKYNREIATVIFDICQPERDGAAFLRQLRQKPLLFTLPVVMISDCFEDAGEEELLRLGAWDCIVKPIQEKLLVSLIRNLIRIQETAVTLSLMEKDDLMGIYNRRAFQHHAEALLNADTESIYDLVISDVDKFKLVNDIYGEKAADEVLKSLADFLQAHLNITLFGRYGSDQFIWLQKSEPDCGEKITRVLADFRAVSPVPNITVQCGIYTCADKNVSMTHMCDNAIFALRSIKTSFSKTVAFYDGPVSQQHYREQMYAARFPEALKNKEFEVWYQPKYDPITEKVMGAEALVRWRNPDGSLNMPGEFLGVFEANGMISQLDAYVFRSVCQQQKKWKDMGLQLFPISVNLSRNSMHQKELAAIYAGIAAEYGIAPTLLPIEITETTATDSIQIQEYALELHRAGFPLHMDDFGSERSSLQTLNMLDFDVVKLDKGLIDFIGSPEGEHILTYTMALSAELGLRVVAEGAETRQQVDFLIENGCDLIQGYYFSRPLPVEAFEKKVTDNLGPVEKIKTKKENLFILSMTSHFEKMMVQRMLPRIPGGFLIYEADEAEHIIYSNAYLWHLFGCENEETFMNLVGGSFCGVVCPEQLNEIHASIEQQIAGSTDDMDYVEYDIIRKDGVHVPVLDYGHLERVGKKALFYVFIYRKNV